MKIFLKQIFLQKIYNWESELTIKRRYYIILIVLGEVITNKRTTLTVVF
jgi:hypothetical protein